MIKYYFKCVDKIQSNASDKPYYLVVFPEKRTVEMGQTICQLHGGHLPVPSNAVENEVRKNGQILSCNDRFYFRYNEALEELTSKFCIVF